MRIDVRFRSWFCGIMKNITVAVRDDVHRRARVRAAERDTSVSALVREFLEGLDEGSTDFETRCRLEDEVIASIRRFGAGDRLGRDDAHRKGGFGPGHHAANLTATDTPAFAHRLTR